MDLLNFKKFVFLKFLKLSLKNIHLMVILFINLNFTQSYILHISSKVFNNLYIICVNICNVNTFFYHTVWFYTGKDTWCHVNVQLIIKWFLYEIQFEWVWIKIIWCFDYAYWCYIYQLTLYHEYCCFNHESYILMKKM